MEKVMAAYLSFDFKNVLSNQANIFSINERLAQNIYLNAVL